MALFGLAAFFLAAFFFADFFLPFLPSAAFFTSFFASASGAGPLPCPGRGPTIGRRPRRGPGVGRRPFLAAERSALRAFSRLEKKRLIEFR